MPLSTLPFADVSNQQQPTNDYLHWDLLSDDLLIDGRTVEQAGKFSTTTRWRLEKAGKLKPIRLGKSKCYRVGDVRALLSDLLQGA